MIKYPIFFLTGQWWHIWNGSVPIEFLHYIPCSPAAAFWMADLGWGVRTQPGKSRKINIRRQQQLTVLTAGGGGESIKLSSPNSAASSYRRSPSHPLPGCRTAALETGWRSVSSVCGCGGVCRPLENTFCCNGYWHVSSEEPGHQLTAAKLARTHSSPRLVQAVQWATGIRTEKIRDKWRYGDTYKHGEARVGAWDHLSVCLGAAAWPPLYCPTRSES